MSPARAFTRAAALRDGGSPPPARMGECGEKRKASEFSPLFEGGGGVAPAPAPPPAFGRPDDGAFDGEMSEYYGGGGEPPASRYRGAAAAGGAGESPTTVGFRGAHAASQHPLLLRIAAASPPLLPPAPPSTPARTAKAGKRVGNNEDALRSGLAPLVQALEAAAAELSQWAPQSPAPGAVPAGDSKRGAAVLRLDSPPAGGTAAPSTGMGLSSAGPATAGPATAAAGAAELAEPLRAWGAPSPPPLLSPAPLCGFPKPPTGAFPVPGCKGGAARALAALDAAEDAHGAPALDASMGGGDPLALSGFGPGE
jgi:hypothetical protein